MTTAPRLAFGPSLEDGVATIVDADTATRWHRASLATTWGESARLMYDAEWNSWGGAADLAEDGVSADTGFDFTEWLAETWDTSPQERAVEVAGSRIAELAAGHPDALPDVRIGGGSPGGNIDAVTAPVDQLAFVASLIDPATDGFDLVRNDELVQQGLLAHLR